MFPGPLLLPSPGGRRGWQSGDSNLMRGRGKAVETGLPTCPVLLTSYLRRLALGTGTKHTAQWGLFVTGESKYLNTTWQTLMYFSTGVTGRMRNLSGSSILGFGAGALSSHSIS